MGTEFQEVLCDEYGIGGDGKYCGDNDAQLARIYAFYYEASGGKHVPREIDAVRASPLGELFRPGILVKHTRGQKWAKGHYKRADTNFSAPPPHHKR
jgi:tubulin beta